MLKNKFFLKCLSALCLLVFSGAQSTSWPEKRELAKKQRKERKHLDQEQKQEVEQLKKQHKKKRNQQKLEHHIEKEKLKLGLQEDQTSISLSLPAEPSFQPVNQLPPHQITNPYLQNDDSNTGPSSQQSVHYYQPDRPLYPLPYLQNDNSNNDNSNYTQNLSQNSNSLYANDFLDIDPYVFKVSKIAFASQKYFPGYCADNNLTLYKTILVRDGKTIKPNEETKLERTNKYSQIAKKNNISFCDYILKLPKEEFAGNNINFFKVILKLKKKDNFEMRDLNSDDMKNIDADYANYCK